MYQKGFSTKLFRQNTDGTVPQPEPVLTAYI